MKPLQTPHTTRLLWPALALSLAASLSAHAQQPQYSAAPAQQGVQQAAPGSARSPWVRQQGLRASRMIGSNVHNPQGQDIGQIEDVVVNLATGKVRFAVLRFDPGFLQLERVFAIPVERLRMVDDQVLVDIPRERLEQSGIESSGWSKDYFSDRARIARLDKDWGLGERAPEDLVRASDLMRSSIVAATTGERIGTIEEIVFAPGRQQVQYVVVGFDRGWLGSDKRAAVDITALHRARQQDTLSLVGDRSTVMRMRPFTEDRYGYYGDGQFVNRESRRAMGAPAAGAPATPAR